MEELREVTYQYTNCPDPTECAARRQRVLDSESRGLMEETTARIIAAASAPAIASSLAQQLLSFQPEAGFERSLGQEITFAHPTEAGPSAPGPSDPTPRDINHRPRPLKPKKRASTPRGLLGASLRKHNLAVSQRSPIVRASPNDNQTRTPQRTPRRRARCVEQNTSASGTCESQSPSHSQRNQGRATSSGHEPNHTAPQVDFCHQARDLP